MSQNPDVQIPRAPTPTMTTCSNCHSAMPSELRFCRNCGFRLGEGVAEYTETVRFNQAQGPMVAQGFVMPAPVKKRRRKSGMAWIFIALLVFFVGAAAFTALLSPVRQNIRVEGFSPGPSKTKSYLGVNGFDTADDNLGVTFDDVEAPDTPADRAGLVGGDVITRFDGQEVRDEDQMSDLMEKTPIGKTVDIEFLRDGEKKTAKLTTISDDENRRLVNAFKQRPEGRAQFGYEEGDAEVVDIPNTKLHGVKLNKILPSRPADLAGIKEGDIVIQFDQIPIRTREEFLMRVRRAIPYSTVSVVVMRGDEEKLERIQIPVKMGRQ